ncbi:helix-turn-helix transcriptional regulator [Rhodobacteraceae bacterium NNCM2]|nr:helix-turn-helix transcriptional regulator [Coraliihabitans acroporae]
MMMNISQEQLGAALGLTFQQIQKYERGLNRIGAGRLYHIARVLSVAPGYFFEGLPQTAKDSDPNLLRRTLEVSEFLASPDGHSIVVALSQIQDYTIRRRILDLARAVAETEAVE